MGGQSATEGWQDTSVFDNHAAAINFTGLKDGWLVVLNQDGSFSHAYKDGVGDFVTEPSEVPGWAE